MLAAHLNKQKDDISSAVRIYLIVDLPFLRESLGGKLLSWLILLNHERPSSSLFQIEDQIEVPATAGERKVVLLNKLVSFL